MWFVLPLIVFMYFPQLIAKVENKNVKTSVIVIVVLENPWIVCFEVLYYSKDSLVNKFWHIVFAEVECQFARIAIRMCDTFTGLVFTKLFCQEKLNHFLTFLK